MNKETSEIFEFLNQLYTEVNSIVNASVDLDSRNRQIRKVISEKIDLQFLKKCNILYKHLKTSDTIWNDSSIEKPPVNKLVDGIGSNGAEYVITECWWTGDSWKIYSPRVKLNGENILFWKERPSLPKFLETEDK